MQEPIPDPPKLTNPIDDDTLITKLNANNLLEAFEAQRELIVYYEHLTETIEDVMQRREYILKIRYFHALKQLEDTKKALKLYKRTLFNIETHLNESPIFVKLRTEIQFYEEYSVILQKQLAEITQKIRSERISIAMQRNIIEERGGKLKKKNQANLALASQINKLIGILTNNPISTNNSMILPGPATIEEVK
jgi:hypothetical protein